MGSHRQQQHRPPIRRRMATALVAVAAVLALSGMVAFAATRETGASSGGALGHVPEIDASSCPVSARLVPKCGVLWGVATERPENSDLTALEKAVGRSFDFVYRFHDINDPIPTADERALVAQGRILHVSIDSRDFAKGADPIPWATVTSGAWDRTLRAQAAGVASLKKPVFVTFEHEPDQPRKAALGTPADFKAAWRHVHQIFAQAGASNAVWTWVASGWDQTFTQAAQMWPGNDVVDWISWEGYNPAGCQSGEVHPDRWVSFADSIGGFQRWLAEHAAQYGIDTRKPVMISEAGSVTDPVDVERTAQWYAAIPEVLQEDYPQVKAIGLWDHTGAGGPACDYRFSRTPRLLQAVATAGRHGWVNTR